ncbi:C-type lectin domain family 4 member D-like [Acropora millepora]|uniref:C-type lectin domain family 4 member D-like n=1 Tax=Acropora millepora TaxID=45264 RepID=UPI001CF15F19|nr:C-type lectin domain family 4 member D-like [Acropora millepora]
MNEILTMNSRSPRMKFVSIFLCCVTLLELIDKQTFGANTDSPQGHESRRSSLFYKVKEGEALTGHIISLHQTRSELDCAHKCLLNSKCASLNFEFQSSRTLSTCETNGMLRTSSTIKLQSRDGFAYYEPIAKLIQEKEIDTSQSPIQQVIVCAPDWHKCNAVCVRFFDVTKTRSEAKNHCEQFRTSAGVKGSLVKIGNQGDNRRIVNIRLSTPSIPQGEYFIGLDDKAVEGEYKWTDGTRATYKNFLRQDLSSDQNRDCVLMRLNHGDSDNGKWETKECNNKLRFICQCPGECTRA